MKSFATIIAFSAAVAGFVAAKPALETRTSCKSNQFWYSKLSCCLDHGGPSTPPTPPRSRDCPSDNWYWNSKQGCCTPRHEDPPEPTCKKGYSWSKGSWCCEEEPTPSTTSHSQPSQTPGGGYGGGYNGGNDGGYNGGNNGGYNGGSSSGGYNGGSSSGGYNGGSSSGGYNGGYSGGNSGYNGWKVKRSHHKRNVELCPSKLTACPISGASTLNKSSDYECIDPLEDLRSCGGCTSQGKGQDCTAIAHSWNVGCVSGSCEVFTCAPGFEVSFDGKTCVPL